MLHPPIGRWGAVAGPTGLSKGITMRNYEHSVTVTTPDGRVLFQVGGKSNQEEGLTDDQIRTRIKDSIIRDLRWDIRIFRNR